jgi:tetratricopeptide (TPR) repeat protein
MSFLNWFDSRAAIETGELLAESFSHEIKLHRETPIEESAQKLYSQAKCFSRDLHLNFYKKTKLVNAFKWGLLEQKIDKQFVSTAARELLLQLCFNGNAGLENGPVSLHAETADEAFYNLGLMLFSLGRFDKAEACFRRTLDIKPDHVEALLKMGHIVSFNGCFDEANTYFLRSLAIKPKLPTAWAALTGLRKMTSADAAWLSTAKKIIRDGIPPLQESCLRFAKGKYCDDVKNFDRAFQHYLYANKLSKTAAKKYDRQKQTLFVDELIQTCNRERMSGLKAGASASIRPIFIVGMPRSGTSLVEQIIASHPQSVGAGELHFWSNAFNTHKNAAMKATFEESLLSKLADEYLRLLSDFSTTAMYVVDKMPGNFAYLGLIHSVFPNARIIHLQRNPIDVCLSCYFQDFTAVHNFTNDLADLAHYYREYHRLMNHWRTVLPPDIFLDVPYEALVHDQEAWSRKIVEFIGLKWDQRCLAFYETERRVATASKWQVKQKMYRSSVERWRNYEKFVGPLMGLMELH